MNADKTEKVAGEMVVCDSRHGNFNHGGNVPGVVDSSTKENVRFNQSCHLQFDEKIFESFGLWYAVKEEYLPL